MSTAKLNKNSESLYGQRSLIKKVKGLLRRSQQENKDFLNEATQLRKAELKKIILKDVKIARESRNKSMVLMEEK